MTLVLSLAGTLAAHDYYFMQLPAIYLLSALSHVPTCWSVPYPCTYHLYFGLGSVRPPLTFWAHKSLLHWQLLLLLRPHHLSSPFSVIVLSSQYLFQRGPIWVPFSYIHVHISFIYVHISYIFRTYFVYVY